MIKQYRRGQFIKLITNIEFLFTWDAEVPVEEMLTGALDAEILKVGHHGSDSSSSVSFLNKVQPEVAIISVGKDNSYGHPAPETLQRLKNAGEPPRKAVFWLKRESPGYGRGM